MTKIYISPSDQTDNPYAYGGANEGDVCNEIAMYLQKELEGIEGIECRRNTSYSITHAINESNAWGADIHLCIHTNAFNGEVMGTRMFHGCEVGRKYCEAVMGEVAPITPGQSDNITERSTLNEVKNVHAITVYLEVGFHDNVHEAKWLCEHTREIAKAIAKGLCKCVGATYKVDDKAVKLYRVQVGAFAVKENAERLKQELVSKGYADAFIT